jgi:osmoprotectant transport system ATP-binding protein
MCEFFSFSPRPALLQGGISLLIRFENVVKKYKQQDVIDGLSFEVAPSEFVVLIGPSGCGKTTILKMINRLIIPTSGKIYIKGEDAAGHDKYELRRNIGYVIQSVGLFPHMTIGENISLVPSLQGKGRKEIAQKCAALMETVGLPPGDYIDRYPAQLSGGQQQRVGVARALAGDPEILLMDEPFSALDPITRAYLQEELLSLQTRLKKTIVFVTHDMNEAVKLANKICIINGGKIVQYDTPENILRNPACDFVREFVALQRNDLALGDEQEAPRRAALGGLVSRAVRGARNVFSALHHRK